MFKLADSLGSSRGVYCGAEGLYLGPDSPLIERRNGIYEARPEREVAALLAAAYDPAPDITNLLPRLCTLAALLQAGELGRAMISAVLLGLGDLSEAAITRLARAEALLKANFNTAELRDDDGRWARDTAAGILLPARASKPSRRRTARGGRAWESQPNTEFRNRLAVAESSADKPDFGYGEVNHRTDALGRYQMTRAGLVAAGMMNANGDWTGKYGIHSRSQFLADHDAQEHALTDFLHETERQLRANGAFDYVGRNLNGVVAPFTITRAGLIAAGHEEGARATRDYLRIVEQNGFTSHGLNLTGQQSAIESRLRTFAEARYA